MFLGLQGLWHELPLLSDWQGAARSFIVADLTASRRQHHSTALLVNSENALALVSTVHCGKLDALGLHRLMLGLHFLSGLQGSALCCIYQCATSDKQQ